MDTYQLIGHVAASIDRLADNKTQPDQRRKLRSISSYIMANYDEPLLVDLVQSVDQYVKNGVVSPWISHTMINYIVGDNQSDIWFNQSDIVNRLAETIYDWFIDPAPADVIYQRESDTLAAEHQQLMAEAGQLQQRLQKSGVVQWFTERVADWPHSDDLVDMFDLAIHLIDVDWKQLRYSDFDVQFNVFQQYYDGRPNYNNVCNLAQQLAQTLGYAGILCNVIDTPDKVDDIVDDIVGNNDWNMLPPSQIDSILSKLRQRLLHQVR